GLTVVFRTLDPGSPGPVAFDGCARQDCAIGALKRFGSDGAEQAGRILFGFAPRLAGIRGAADESRPTHWVRPGLVPQEKGFVLAEEENRVPAWRVGFLPGDFRLGPLLAVEARPPDSYIAIALAPSAKPSRQEFPRFDLDNG